MKPLALTMANYVETVLQAVSGPIARSAISGMALRLIGMALIFAQAVIAARMLGAEGYGVVSIILAIAHVAAVFVLFGLGNFAIAEVPRLLTREGPNAVRRFVRYGFGRVALLSLVVLPVTAVIIALIISDLPLSALAIASLIVPLFAVLQLARGIALGLERSIAAQLPSEIVRPSFFLIALIAAWLMFEVNTATFLSLYVAAAALAFVIAVPSMQIPSAEHSLDKQRETQAGRKSQWDRAALPFLGLHLATIFQVELATILLGLFASPEAAGQFQPVARISMVLLLPILALNLRFGPKIAALHEAGQRTDILRLSRKYTWASMAMMCAACLTVGATSPWLLQLFGPEFVGGAPLVWIIILGRIAFTAFGPAGQLLTMTGHSEVALKAMAYSLLVESVLGSVLILWLGITGAALAIVCGLLVRGGLMVAASKRSLDIGLKAYWFGSDR